MEQCREYRERTNIPWDGKAAGLLATITRHGRAFVSWGRIRLILARAVVLRIIHECPGLVSRISWSWIVDRPKCVELAPWVPGIRIFQHPRPVRSRFARLDWFRRARSRRREFVAHFLRRVLNSGVSRLRVTPVRRRSGGRTCG